MVIAEIAEGLTGIKTALDILKGLKKSGASSAILTEIADLQTALIEVQQGIMAANQTHTADIERIRDLEEDVARLKAWDGEKDKYEFKAVYAGAFAYASKPDRASGESPHWLCAHCYEQRKKSYLQRGEFEGGKYRWNCPECKTHIIVRTPYGPRNPWNDSLPG